MGSYSSSPDCQTSYCSRELSLLVRGSIFPHSVTDQVVNVAADAIPGSLAPFRQFIRPTERKRDAHMKVSIPLEDLHNGLFHSFGEDTTNTCFTTKFDRTKDIMCLDVAH